MATAAIAAAASLTLAAMLVAGCGSPPDDLASPSSALDVEAPAPTPGSPVPSQNGAPRSDELLEARASGDPRGFASLVSRAAATCADPDSARQLGQLSAVAERWADSVAFARPKAQARTEAQLDLVDWADVLAPC